MLQFLQFKPFGRHKVPDNWVVVTAGNPPEYNRSVHEFDIVTLDRLKRIQVEPDYDAWSAYALAKGVHPAVTTFLDAKKNRFYSVESTLDGKSFVTARSWDDLSDIIRVYERLGKKVDESLIAHYVQNDRIAAEFSAYYDLFDKYRDDYRIESILEGNPPADVLERAQGAEFDERVSVIELLLDAIEIEEKDLMARADLLVAVRDDLREVKSLSEYQDVEANSIAAQLQAGMRVSDVRAALDYVLKNRQTSLLTLAASGGSNLAKKRLIQDEIAMLQSYKLALESGSGTASDDMETITELFAKDSDMQEQIDNAKSHLSHAFAFIDDAFGDEKEMLIFVTDLTRRPSTARFIAQFGSDEYHQHNQRMILSDAQNELRASVEELEHIWDI